MKNYLAHHGVAGQKWGQRHGPPYPLSRDPANAKRAQADHKKNKASNKTSSSSPRVSKGSAPSNMQVRVMRGIVSDRKYRKELAKQQKKEQEEYEAAQKAEKAEAVKRRKYLEKEAKKGRLTRDEQAEYTELIWSDKRQAEAEAAKQQAQQEKYKNTMSVISSAAVMTQKIALAAERIGYARNALSMLSERQKDRNQNLKIRQMELNTDIAKKKIEEESNIKKAELSNNYKQRKDTADRSQDNNKEYSKRIDTKDKNLNKWSTSKKIWSTSNKDGSYKTYNKDKNEWSINKDSINKDSLFTVSKDKKYTTWNDVDIGAKNKDGTYKYNDVISNYRRSQSYQKTMQTKLSSAYTDYAKTKYSSYVDLQPSVKSIKVSESSLNRIREAQQRRTRMESIANQKAMTRTLQRDFLNSKANKGAYYSMRHSMFLSPEEQMLLYLAHHGVAGQKWGQRHGPPYPLSRDPANAKRAQADYRKNDTRTDKSNVGRGLRVTAVQLLPAVGALSLMGASIAVGAPFGVTMAGVYAGGILGFVASDALTGGPKRRKSAELDFKRDMETQKLENRETPKEKETRKKKLQSINEASTEYYSKFDSKVSNIAKVEYSSKTNKKLQKVLDIKKDSNISEVLGSKDQTLASKSPEKISHGVNPNYSKVAAGYHDNCLKCSLTMEMRMRGYNVQAKSSNPSELGAMSQQTSSGLMAHLNKTPDTYMYSNISKSKNKVKKKDFISSLPDGRYMINGPTTTGGAHSIYGIKEGKKITYYDTQTNNGTAYSFFNAASGQTVGKTMVDRSTDYFPVEFVRLDNLSESDFYNISDYCEKSK